MRLSPHEIAWLAIHVNPSGVRAFTRPEAVEAVATILAESGGETDLIAWSPKLQLDGTPNPAYGNADHGGGQISGFHHGRLLQQYRFRDPHDNMRMFKLVWTWAGHSFGPWNVSDEAVAKWAMAADIGMRYPFEPINPHTTAWRR